MKPWEPTRRGAASRGSPAVADSRLHGFEAEVWSVLNVPDSLDLNRYAALVVAASVHVGKHEPEMVRFVKRNLQVLNAMNNAFITITLSQAGVERADATDAERERSAANVAMMTGRFIADTGWRPQRIHPVAGELRYTKYNPLLRLVMKFISKMAGGATDTSRDYAYTNWAGLNDLAAGIVEEVRS